MALAKIKKIEIIGLQEHQQPLLALLKKEAKVELIRCSAPEVVGGTPEDSSESMISRLDEAIDYLTSLGEKVGFVEGLAGLKPNVYFGDMEDVLRRFDWQSKIDELAELRRKQAELLGQRAKLEQQRQQLLPWSRLALPLESLRPSCYCNVILGEVGNLEYPQLLAAAAEAGIELHGNPVSRDKSVTRLVLIHLKAEGERLDPILRDFRLEQKQLDHCGGTAAENLRTIAAQMETLEERIAAIQDRLSAMGEEALQLKMVRDHLAGSRIIRLTGERLQRQEYTFAITGWTRNADLPHLQDKIAALGREIALFVSDPAPGDDVPVVLENRRLVKPFEFITYIFGMPQYGEIDPTPFLAPFFFLYFGFCVSDAGYGLMLGLLSLFVLKKYRLGPTGTSFWRMLFFCSISTIAIGVLSGSWFGNLIDLLGASSGVLKPLVRWKDALIILDPMKEPTKLLGVALGFGIVQVWFGVVIAAIGNIKNRRYADVLLDQVPLLTLLFGLTGLGAGFLKLIGDVWQPLFKAAALLGGLGLVLTQGRSEKGLGSKLFYGCYNLYNALSGYLSDILSYSRLWALGLVTGVMAVTINLIAVQFSKIVPTILPFLSGIPWLKAGISGLILVLIFVFGHIVSILMNLLGAFVHPLRLQFVEFFSKFFKPGGNRFEPYRDDSKYINIKYERS